MYVNCYLGQMARGQGAERGVQQVKAQHMVAKEVKWQMLLGMSGASGM